MTALTIRADANHIGRIGGAACYVAASVVFAISGLAGGLALVRAVN